MEYADNGDLYQYIKARIKKGKFIKEEWVWSMFC